MERSTTDPNPAACLSNRPASVLRTCAQISTMNTPHVPWQHTLPSLNISALTTETALLIRFMREQARAKSAGRELTYAILPGLLLSAQWLRISLISNQPGPPQISHSHTKYYNSGAIPGPAPASVPPKYQHLREQTPSCQSIIASHGTAGEGLAEKGGRGGAAGGWMSGAPVEDKTNTSWVKESHRSVPGSVTNPLCCLYIWWCLLTSAVDPYLLRNRRFNLLCLWSYKNHTIFAVTMMFVPKEEKTWKRETLPLKPIWCILLR